MPDGRTARAPSVAPPRLCVTGNSNSSRRRGVMHPASVAVQGVIDAVRRDRGKPAYFGHFPLVAAHLTLSSTTPPHGLYLSVVIPCSLIRLPTGTAGTAAVTL